MEHLSLTELRDRVVDLMPNLLTLTEQCQIGFIPADAATEIWFVRWTALLEEFASRFGPYPAGFSDGSIRDAVNVSIPRPDRPLAAKAAKAVRDRGTIEGPYLAKYGKRKYLAPAYETGAIRISAASYYSKDTSLGRAIRDDELNRSIESSGKGAEFRVFSGRTGRFKGTIRPGPYTCTRQGLTDYYVFCLSSILVPRLFLDFDDSDACLLITQPKIFLDKIMAGTENTLPGWGRGAGVVKYYDPLNAKADEIRNVPFCKHFRCAYQQECRLIWGPPEPVHDLQPINIELGSLKDCSELILL